MLRSLVDLEKFAVVACDGASPLGQVSDVYFDDEAWVVRYLLLDPLPPGRGRPPGRQVLVSTVAVGDGDWSAKVLPLSLTTEEVRGSPGVDAKAPVSRLQERAVNAHFGYPCYWDMPSLWTGGTRQGAAQGANSEALSHLHSGRALQGHCIRAIDGDIGDARGLLADQDRWVIRFLVLRTGAWWPGHDVLIAPEWIDQPCWSESSIQVDLRREQLQGAPAYDPRTSLRREQEVALYAHYGRPAYWRASIPTPAARR